MSTQEQQMAIGSCSRAKPAIVQYNHDAKLTDAFDRSKESGSPFNYSKEVQLASGSGDSPAEVPAYLNKIQRGGLVQPFGCLLCVVEPTFSILAYSENAHESLGPVSLGVDARTLFAPSSSASLAKAVGSKDLSLSNPIWVCSAVTEKHFYAILHRVDVGIVVDLEPAIAPGGDPGPSIAGAVQSQKLAARVISRLQSLPGGDIGALCGALVENVRELTGYDRVMVYKFHEDEHGEVLAEIRRSDLDSYLGLHYPATDIPQAARFLFKQNRVRMICNCNAKPVRVIEDDQRLRNPLCLVNSTLRAPHGCHAEYMANMGSIASLVMAVVVNDKDSMRLWGLVVCHHTAVRYVPFPLRYACQFLMQAFALQLSMELQLAAQVSEKKTFQTQALLCDMLMRENAVTSIVTGSPNIMDLVKCNGAAMYYNEEFYLLGVTPTESQLADIVHWLLTFHHDSTGLSTESLAESGYPNAASLGDQVCGMASVRINSKDFMFCFRSETAKEIKWGGAKHHPEVKDDGGRMHPRLSFNAFLEVKKTQSLPWEEAEMNAIHSLQLITRTSIENTGDPKGKDSSGILQEPEIKRMDELSSVACEMVRLIETAIVPVIAVDCAGHINGWNGKAAELTGLPANEAIGKSLVYELIHEDSRQVVSQHLSRALQGYEDKGIELKLRTFDLQLKEAAVFIVANACCSKDYNKNIVGVCFLGQDMTEVKVVMDKFVHLQGDYKAIVQSLNPLIPPIFTSDENTCCSEWNAAMETLTGWRQEEVIGKLLIGEIFGSCCRLKDQDALLKIKILLYKASSGKNTEKAYFGFHDKKGKYIETLLTVNTRTDMNGNIIGCVGFLQTTTPDLMQLFETQRQHERKWLAKLKELAYIRQEIKNPLSGSHFTHQLLEATDISDDQRQILVTSSACEQQLMKILEDMDVECLENGYMELDIAGFSLGEVISAVVSQVMPKVKEKNLKLLSDIPEEIKTMRVYGDQIRLQQVLADFFMNIVVHAPCSDSWVQIEVVPSSASSELDSVHLHLRMTHPGQGLPSELIEDMFGRTECATHEGLVLNIASMLLKTMNGNVQYIREAEKCYFVVNIRFRSTEQMQ